MTLPNSHGGLFRMIHFTSTLFLIFILSIKSAFPQFSNYRVREIGLGDGLINPKVLSICTDRYGYIWLGTNDGIDRYDGLTFREYKSGEESGLPSVRMVTNFFLDASGTLWCLSDNKFITTYSYEEDRFSIVDTLPGNLKVTDLLVDDSLNIWIGTDKGLYLLKKDNKQDYSISVFNREKALFSNQFINKIYRQWDDLVWMCTDNGLFRIRIASEDTLVSRYYFDDNPGAWVNSVNSMVSDKSGNYWLAGVADFLKQYPEEFIADTGQHKIARHLITLPPMVFQWVNNRPGNATFFTSISYDNNNALFLKTPLGIYMYKIHSEEWTKFLYLPDINFVDTWSRENLRTLFYNNSDGLLWASINTGLAIISTSKVEYDLRDKGELNMDPQCPSGRLLYLYKDPQKRKYAAYCTSMEYLRSLKTCTHIFSLQDVDTLLTLPPFINYLTTIKDSKSFYWFFSDYLGVLKYRMNNDTLFLVRLYDEGDGLPDDFMVDLTDDEKGRFWITTFHTFSCFDPKEEKFYNFSDFNLGENWFSPGSFRDETGKIHLPYIAGTVVIDPDELLSRYMQPEVIISRIYNSGKSLSGNNEPVEPAVTEYSNISVPYRNNYISIELGNLDFLDPNSCFFMYKMDGIDKEWLNNMAGRNISYGTLKPGKYTFQAFAVRKDGMMKSGEVRLDLTITPAIYQRPVFYAFIIFLILIILFTTIKIREKSLHARAEYLEKEVQEKTAQIIGHSAEMEKMKNRFYTNVSHEFRTPLTLINSSAREIEKAPDSKNINKFTGTIYKSCERLLRLVNELLDLSKLEAGKMDLKVAEGDLASVVRFVYQNYISDAERRGIKYSFRSDPEIINCWFDKEIVQKIIHNLISNALKFTSGGRAVSLEVNLHNDRNTCTDVQGIPFPRAVITVKDTGKGISPEHLPKIFDRFYQADSSGTRGYEGTGIGLAIVNEMSVRHHGKVLVESREGEGSEFTVVIPVGKSNFGENERIEENTELRDESIPVVPLPGNKPDKRTYEPGGSGKKVVLVAEDNDDLREFLAEQLGKRFRVIEALNGKDGLEKTEEFMPDIIISDIMMPEVDGIDLCSSVKNNIMTCHIPVILLTAKADIDSKLEGLRTGADDYLTKPFNEEELAARIDNLLLVRQKLREKFISSPVSNIPGIRTGCSDESLMRELLKAIEANMIKSSFSLDDIATELRIGKRSLQRKIRSLTGITASEFICMIKIKHAAALIAEKKTSVSEAAYATGFSSLSHFTRSFRKITGVNPSEYRKSVS